jgi:hypothetical membrane protein
LAFALWQLCGIFGTALILLGIFISLVSYRDLQNSRYSPLNHFISELGEVGVSRASWVFNLGLILGGLSLVPFLFELGSSFRSLLGWFGTLFGIIAAVSVTGVGLFPMNNLKAHTRVAVTYFRAGLIMILFFGLAILFQTSGRQIVTPAANLLSIFAYLAYLAFLSLAPAVSRKQADSNPLDPARLPERPRFWLLPILEWLVFFIYCILAPGVGHPCLA